MSITLPFTPVPITGQTLGVLLIGALLGGRCGAFAVLPAGRGVVSRPDRLGTGRA